MPHTSLVDKNEPIRINRHSAVLAYNLRLFRKEVRLTQSELAERSQISFRSYQQIESGIANPTLNTIESLAAALGVNCMRLLYLSAIKLTIEKNEFIRSFKKKFYEFPKAVTLRTTDGVVLWGNKFVESLHPQISQWPYNMIAGLEKHPEILALVRAQLHAEKLGCALPYVLPNTSDALILDKMRYYRCYPTSIYLDKSPHPLWTAVYATTVESDLDLSFFEFSNGLLACDQASQ